MAEQFLSRLNKIEESINQLGETLKRMITILGTVTEIKSEVRASKDEIVKTLGEIKKQAPASPGKAEDNTELAKMVVQEVGAVRVFVQESMEALKKEVKDMLANIEVSVPAPVVQAAPAAPAPQTPAAAPVQETAMAGAPSTLPADRGMKVADELQKILDSMKMGCVAGDVLDVMGEAKAEIMKIVPSDPIMVGIDKWAGIVAGYPKRNELQARDILKIKKALRKEIPKYRPA
ncbi:hypothetical protein EU546_06240 [Candidatus Thorarchaeota archaeon]|nr:MAG: hypothetical protein EU546_06240 [Candidatus Thorarchaeota archaeon]